MFNKRTERGWTPTRKELRTWGAVAGAAVGVVGNAIMSDNSSNASQQAAGSIQGGDAAAIKFQSDAFNKVQALLKPFVDAGTSSLGTAQSLLGVNGNPEQQFQIDQIRNGAAFGSLKQVGENAILSNASATGGLRGGNVNASLANYDESTLASLIQSQYSNLMGIAGMGQNAAAGTGSAALSTGSASAGFAQNAGVAGAGGILGTASAQNGLIGGIANAAGTIAGRLGSQGGNIFGGGGGGAPPNTSGPVVAGPGFDVEE